MRERPQEGRYAACGRRLRTDELVTVAAAASTSLTVGLGWSVRTLGARGRAGDV